MERSPFLFEISYCMRKDKLLTRQLGEKNIDYGKNETHAQWYHGTSRLRIESDERNDDDQDETASH